MQLLGEKEPYKFYYDGKRELPFYIEINGSIFKEFKTRDEMKKFYKESCRL